MCGTLAHRLRTAAAADSEVEEEDDEEEELGRVESAAVGSGIEGVGETSMLREKRTPRVGEQ